MLRLAPALIIALLVLPVAAGLLMVLLPAFGYLPALGGHGGSLAPWQMLFAQPGLWRSVAVSFTSGLVSAAIALVIVVLFLAASRGTWLDRSIRRLVSPLLAIPHAAIAFGFAFLIAPSGLLARLISPSLTGWERPPDALIINDPWGLSLIAGLVLKEVPFLLLMSLAALPQLVPEKRLMLARSLGYSPTIAWLKTVLPSLYPLIRLPVYAVIAYATSVVDMALILGPTLPPTLSVSILRWFNDPDISHRFMASAAAVLQLGVTIAALLCWWLLEQLTRLLARGWLTNGSRQRGEIALRVVGRSALLFASITALAALVGLGLFSLAGFWRFPELLPQMLTLDHWQRSGPMLVTPLVNTALIGLISTTLATALVLTTLENEHRQHIQPRRALWLLYLPLLVPQIAFLFGLIVAAESLGVRPQLGLVIAGHLLFVLPYVYLSLAEAYRRLDPRWLQVARSLGVSRSAAFWKVRLPLLLAPLLTAFAVGLAVSIGQYLPTQLLGAGRVTTVTTEAVALAAGSNRRLIGVWALVQAGLPLIGFMLALGLPRLLGSHRRELAT
ncbi:MULTISPECIES: ABC transporter permease subunit [Halomonadaceae]|uniref:ABC transporter permease subunit n=2 Tax=Vreelandella TaxID=3137766 RepID=A0A7Z0RXD1_9GAMM|nr:MULTISPECIES: ABC transporter permease subunit [Halomonas]AJY52222.1 ABC-type transporter, integral membrane subunit [Halomonas sp. KO116]NYS77070.1 ABC transporter permease subunit [Halomonas glaciei]|tara:strand:- start:7680 stop:9353 length:1674 start_codon:yes stop_codon:yes gene_type:complete